jgi:molecular chaperone GrpE (heat shock protein)
MNNTIDDLRALHISNLITINELNRKIEDLERDKHMQFLELVAGVVEAIDIFEKVKKKNSKESLSKSRKGKKVTSRYKKVLTSLQQLLLQYEITEISFPDNQIIPGLCKIVGDEADAELPDDTIVSIVKNGYIRGTELIREAEVIVVKNQESLPIN